MPSLRKSSRVSEAPGQGAERPLAGKKVVVTRARSQAKSLAWQLERHGARVIEFPTIEIWPPDEAIDTGSMEGFDWIVFTSLNTVTRFVQLLQREGKALADLKGVKICAMGPSTAAAVESQGCHVDFVPEKFIAESVLEGLKAREEGLDGRRFLLPRGNLARSFLPGELRKHGADVTEIIVYRTVRPETPEGDVEALIAEEPDIVTFTSSSTACNFCEILGEKRIHQLKEATVFASIGPMTTKAAQKAGLEIGIEPQQHDVPGLVEAIVQWTKQG